MRARRVYWTEVEASDVPVGDGWLGPRERTLQADLHSAKRRSDWRLGRCAAKQLVCDWLAADATGIEIVAAANGAPVVLRDGQRVDLSLSLSHRADRALCVLAAGAIDLGCDLELVEPRSREFVADFFTLTERALVASGPPSRRPLMANLVWSAKESALKVLGVGLGIDTRAVVVRSVGRRVVGGWLPLTVEIRAREALLRGWWRSDGATVSTILVAAGTGSRCAAPVSLRRSLQVVPNPRGVSE